MWYMGRRAPRRPAARPRGWGRRAPASPSGTAPPPPPPPPRPAGRLAPREGAPPRPQPAAHRDLVWRPAQPVPAGRAAARDEKPGPFELEEHLLEVALRDVLARSDLLDGTQPLAVRQGQVEHGLDGVLPLGRDPHAAGILTGAPAR